MRKVGWAPPSRIPKTVGYVVHLQWEECSTMNQVMRGALLIDDNGVTIVNNPSDYLKVANNSWNSDTNSFFGDNGLRR